MRGRCGHGVSSGTVVNLIVLCYADHLSWRHRQQAAGDVTVPHAMLSTIIAFQQNNSLYASSPDPLSWGD